MSFVDIVGILLLVFGGIIFIFYFVKLGMRLSLYCAPINLITRGVTFFSAIVDFVQCCRRKKRRSY